MSKKSDIDDFLKKEDKSTLKYIKEFLENNNIPKLDKEEQIIETAKLISKFPWGKARTIEELLVTKNYGTCTSKHLTLKACYDFLGIKSYDVMCSFRWGEQGIKFPNKLQKILEKGEWDHGHNFVRVEMNDKISIDIDITWNAELEDFGFKVLPENWKGKNSFVAVKIKQRWDNVDMKKKKIELIENLCPELRKRRKEFLELFAEWIESVNEIRKNI